MVLIALSLREWRVLGRSVKAGLYSMTNSVSSLVGEVGTPMWTGADWPWNRSPKSLLWRFWDFSGEEGLLVGELVLSLET